SDRRGGGWRKRPGTTAAYGLLHRWPPPSGRSPPALERRSAPEPALRELEWCSRERAASGTSSAPGSGARPSASFPSPGPQLFPTVVGGGRLAWTLVMARVCSSGMPQPRDGDSRAPSRGHSLLRSLVSGSLRRIRREGPARSRGPSVHPRTTELCRVRQRVSWRALSVRIRLTPASVRFRYVPALFRRRRVYVL